MLTKDEQLKLFTDTCQYWVNRFGLKGWEISYMSRPMDENVAEFVGHIPSRQVTIVLNNCLDDDEATEKEIKKCALHEVCELLLARIVEYMKSEHTPDNVVEEATHEVIHTIVNFIDDNNLQGDIP